MSVLMNRKKISTRFLFWFRDRTGWIKELNEEFFPLSHMYSRLLADFYTGKKIKYINYDLKTDDAFVAAPNSSKHELKVTGYTITYSEIFDLESFQVLGKDDQKRLLWGKVYDILSQIKSSEISEASTAVYKKGLELDLNWDYNILETDFEYADKDYLAAIKMSFDSEGMYATLLVVRDNTVVYSNEIDNSILGSEFFLEMYKSLEVVNGQIILKGNGAVDYLPLKIKLSSIMD